MSPNITLHDPAKLFEFRETLNRVPCRVSERRLFGGPSDGVTLVELEVGDLSLGVLPTRGMGIWRGRCGDVQLKWDAPCAGPVHPALVNLADPSGLGWLDGFNEWLVRCGLENNGSPEFDEKGTLKYPLHGRIANTPAHSVTLTIDKERGEITLTGLVRESRMFFKRLELTSSITLRAGTSGFTIRDTVTNISGEPGAYQLLYHINNGMPFITPGARVVVPFNRLVPRSPDAVENLPDWNKYGPETPGSNEVVFFLDPAADKDGWVKTMLINAEGNCGLVLCFDKKTLPLVSLWKSRLSNNDGYVSGIEPAVNFPNNYSFEKEKGRVVPLQPGESRMHELRFEVLHSAVAVKATEKEIEAIHKTAAGKIESKPVPEWVS
ncbi:MAG: aldose 1-epimerase family protein [Planctomycetaceae bacterium]|jgi:galactose mutarotase-like enzyme|nr:aldose 1-epimerase family protein [Planctomycetaceae bacterium]